MSQKEAVLIYPHHLFEKHSLINSDRLIVLIEEHLFFKLYSFHKQKLVFHRASMKAYAKLLTEKGYQVEYIESAQSTHSRSAIEYLAKKGISIVHTLELDDYWLEQRLKKACNENEISLTISPSTGFLSPISWSLDFISNQNSYFLTPYYIAQRKRLSILMEKGKPIGGKWSFDSENRKKLGKDVIIPGPWKAPANEFIAEAKTYVESCFKDNPGCIDTFQYPVTHVDARKALAYFLEKKFSYFGHYQDALTTKDDFVFHSLLSPLINSGLLTPEFVVAEALAFYETNNIELNSVEGFIRQIIGWREYVRAVYHGISVKQRTSNFYDHQRKIPYSFWTGTTNIHPIDHVIHKTLTYSYAHHIERLMVLGNFMLLCEFSPFEVYRWFMELFIDSYDWVMVPNVYGMSQYADGGMMTTKPYISSSNYIKKMSDYTPGPWCETWDALYWRFIDRKKDSIQINPRMGVMVKQLHAMDGAKRKRHFSIAEKFLSSL